MKHFLYKVFLLTLFFSRNLFCMEMLNERTIKPAINRLFNHMFHTYTQLQDKRNDKATLLTYASGGKARFARCLAERYMFADSLICLDDPHFLKKVDTLFRSCRGNVKFNEEWAFTVFDRAPLSYKFMTKEKNSMRSLRLATKSRLCRRAIRDFFVRGESQYHVDLYIKDSVIDLIYGCADYLTNIKKLARTYNRWKKFFGIFSFCEKISFLQAEVDILKARIEQQAFLFDMKLEKSSFLLNQLPSVRDDIYKHSCANPDNCNEFYCKHLCPYRSKKNVCDVLKMLCRQEYSCY